MNDKRTNNLPGYLQTDHLSKPVFEVKCPECTQSCTENELEVFGGVCEQCFELAAESEQE